MLFVLGSILAGVLLYDHFVDNAKQQTKEDEKRTQTRFAPTGYSLRSVVHHVKSGEGEVSLPSCKLTALELGPSTDPKKATLQIVVNKSVEIDFKPVTNIGSKARYVKLTPTQYQYCTSIVRETNTNSIPSIVLKTKKKGKVPITAYYSRPT